MSQEVLKIIAAAGLNFSTATPNAAQKIRGYTTIYYDPTSNTVPRQWWQLSADKNHFEAFPGTLVPVTGSVGWANIIGGGPYDSGLLADALNAKVDGGVFTAAMELKYTFPVGGIPRGDLDAATNAILDRANAQPADPILTVNGEIPDVSGNLVVSKGDLGLDQVDNTSDTTKFAAAATFTNKVTSEPKVLAANGAYLGRVRDGFNAGVALTPWKMVYIDFAGVLRLADNSSATPSARGMAVETKAVGQPCRFLHDGPIRNDAWNWTPGGDLFMSTAGGITQTVPIGAGLKTQVVGYALTSTVAYICMGQCNTVGG